ncbi:MAG: hypothetical protein ACLSBB_15940 [Ruthenibacterium lactatiformans]
MEIDEEYHNHETLGMLTIRKTGEVLAGWAEDDSGVLDPQFSGEAWPGHFVYEERPIPNAEFTITANENVYTQDRQTDASGNRTLWYAKGCGGGGAPATGPAALRVSRPAVPAPLMSSSPLFTNPARLARSA